MILFWLATVTFFIAVWAGLDVVIGTRTLVSLVSIPADAGPLKGDRPRVSVVIAARDEERHLQASMRSLFALVYERFEIIVVDDRSSDGTASILKRLKSEFPALEVVTVTELPDGWLGKNHALYTGYTKSKGDLILFTDADVMFEPSTLGRAVNFLTRFGLDHLTLLPQIDPPRGQFFVRAFNLYFAQNVFLFTRCWRARRAESACHIGIGAFNLLRRDAYEAIGTHEAIRLRPDDGIKLGKLIKLHHRRSDVVMGRPLVRIEFYRSVGETIRGFTKNFFSGLDYRIGVSVFSMGLLFLFNLWPVLALFVTHGAAFWANVAVIAVIVGSLAMTALRLGEPPAYALLYPVSGALYLYILLCSTFLTLFQRGIWLRGTFYSLRDLERNTV